MSEKIQSAERVSQTDPSDNYVFQRSLLAYHHAAELISGDVLEIGTGSGYGISIISPHSASFVTVDKNIPSPEVLKGFQNVEFHRMTVPPLEGIKSGGFDFVISFQVIEHIKKDYEMLDEIYRVLRPGGKLIISTPNRPMSITRNPWHVREYSVDEFRNKLLHVFAKVETYGVFGNEKVMDYYEKNCKSVERYVRYDIFDFQHRMPAWLLRIPYDLLNRMNRRNLLADNTALTGSITMEDYRIAPATERCFDLFCIAQK